MKTYKNIKISALLLLVAIIIFASFFGIYKKEEYHVINKIKSILPGMEFTEKRVATLSVDDSSEKVIYDKEGNVVEDDGETEYTEENGYTTVEEKVNSEDKLTLDNYKNTVKLLKKRIKDIEETEYKMSLNEETGTITVELPENDKADNTLAVLSSQGILNIIDTETEEVLMDNSDLKTANTVYNTADGKTVTVYLALKFNKEGAKKLEEISKVYIKTEEEIETVETNTDEETEEDDTENIKYISILIDGETYSQTYFGETMTSGEIYIPITETEDTTKIEEYSQAVDCLATLLNNGPLELKYDVEDEVVATNITTKTLWIGISFFALSLFLLCLYLIIKFKGAGFVATLLEIGYVATLLLVLRYTNVTIKLTGIIGIYLSSVLNFVFEYLMLNLWKKDEKIIGKSLLKFFLKTIPIYVIAVILCFMPYMTLASLGMTLLWGSITIYVYNLLITKNILEI